MGMEGIGFGINKMGGKKFKMKYGFMNAFSYDFLSFLFVSLNPCMRFLLWLQKSWSLEINLLILPVGVFAFGSVFLTLGKSLHISGPLLVIHGRGGSDQLFWGC